MSNEVDGSIKFEYNKSIIENIVDNDAKEEVNKSIITAVEEAKFDIDKALDSYDPTFPRYKPSPNAVDFFNIMRLVQGGDFEFNTPIAHYFMVDLLLNEITDTNVFPFSEEVCKTINLNNLRLAFMESRGMSKSTVIISFFGVYSAIKGVLPNGIGKVWFYLVIAASSRGGARVNALAVKAMCEDSVFIKDYFESVRYTESETEFVRKGNGPKKNRSFLIRYQGVGTGIRGSRYGERRICCILFDDVILNEAAAYSKTITENIESAIHSDSVAALKGGGKGRIINCFTPFHYMDVNTQLVTSGAYTPCVIPIAKNFDADSNKLKANAILSSWEAMHPAISILQMVRDAKRVGKLGSFLQERMLRLTSGADRLIPDSCFQWYDRNVVENHIDRYNVYITTDYTTTSGENSDFSGIATWAVSSNDDWFLLNLTLRKRSMQQQYEDTLNEAAYWTRKGKYVEIGVEIDGNQNAHIYSLEKMMMQRGSWFSFARDINDEKGTRKGILSRGSGVKKHERFRIASQILLQKKMWFPKHLKDDEDMREFISQIQGATHKNFTRADDGCDLISMIKNIKYVLASEDSSNIEFSDNEPEVDRYFPNDFDDDDDIMTGSTIF